MFCPINSQEWYDLVKAQGEEKAQILWNEYEGYVPDKFYNKPFVKEVSEVKEDKKEIPSNKSWKISPKVRKSFVDSYSYMISERMKNMESDKDYIKNRKNINTFLKQKTEEKIKEFTEKGDSELVNNYQDVLDNWDNFTKMLEKHLFSLGLKAKKEIVEEADPEEQAEKMQVESKNSLNTNMYESINGIVSAMIYNLRDTTINPDTGLYSLVEVAHTRRILDNHLMGMIEDRPSSLNPKGKSLVDKMLEKLDDLSSQYPHLIQLKEKLLEAPESIRMNFLSVYSKQTVLYNTSINDVENESVKIINADSQGAKDIILDKSAMFFQSEFFYEDGRIIEEKRNTTLDFANRLKTAYDTLNEKQRYGLLKKLYHNIGFEISNEIIDRYLSDEFIRTKATDFEDFKKKTFTGGNYVSLLNPFLNDKKSFNSLNNITKWDEKKNPIRDFGSILNRFARISAEFSKVPGEAMVISNGKSFWTKSENSTSSKIISSWKNQPELLEEHLTKQYHKHSIYGKALLKDIKSGANNINLEVYLSTRIVGEEEVGYGDINPIDDLIERSNKLLNGYSPTMTPADKNVLQELSGLPVFKSGGTFDSAVDLLYNSYFIAEYERSLAGEIGVKNFDKVFKDFYWFPTLNNNPLVFKKDEKGDNELDVTYIKSEIKRALIGHVNKLNNTFNEYGLLVKNTKGEILDLVGLANKKSYLSDYGNLNAAIIDIVTNGIIGNVEFTMLFAGDPAFYKDLSKRASAPQATGRDLVWFDNETDPVSRTFNVTISKDITLASEFIDDYKKALINKMKDSMSLSEAKAFAEKTIEPYKNIDEADAQGYQTAKRLRDVSRQAGLWSLEKQEAYDRLTGKTPGVTSEDIVLFQPTKQQHYELKDVNGVLVPVYLKYSQAVLWPALVKETKLEALLNFMENSGADEHIFASGVKVGEQFAVKPEDIISGKTLKAETITLDNFFTKIQQVLPSKFLLKQKALEASQIGKNILANIEKNSSKYDGIKGEDIINIINSIQGVLSDRGLDVLKRKWFKGEDLNQDAIYKDIIKSLEEDGINSNIISALEKGAPIEGIPMSDKIEQVILSQLNKSSVKKSMPGGALIQMSSFGFQKIEGKNLTELNEINGIRWFKDIDYLKGPRINEKGKLIRAQVLIPHYIVADLKNKYSAEIYDKFKKSVDELNGRELSEIFASSLSGVIGYRIPNQSMSSIDSFDVVGILPDTAGDSIVTYRELPAKTGADFDIDKMYIMLHNLEFNRETKTLSKVKFLDNTVPLEDRYFTFFREKLRQDVRKNINKTVEEVYKENGEIKKELNEVQEQIKFYKEEAKAKKLNWDTYPMLQKLFKDELRIKSYFTNLSQLREDEIREAILKEAEEGRIPTLEEFGNLSLVEQNTTEALQNYKLELYDNILRNSAGHVITPLDAKDLTEHAYYLAVLSTKGKDKADEYMAVSKEGKGDWIKKNLLNYDNLEEATTITQQEIKVRNLAGKAGTGQTANHLTHHSYAQQVGLMLNYGLAYPGMGNQIDLSKQINDNNLFITDVISAWLNAYVDNAKDPYISFINNNTKTANTVFMMLRAGADMFWLNTFMVQPIIKKFVNFQYNKESKIKRVITDSEYVAGMSVDVNESGELIIKKAPTITVVDKDGVSKEIFDKNNTHKVSLIEEFLNSEFPEWRTQADLLNYTHLTTEQLEEQIISPSKIQQFKIFKEYIKMQTLAKKVNSLTVLTKSDTTGASNSLLEASRIKEERQKLIESGDFTNADKIFSDTQQAALTKNSIDFALTHLDKLLLTGTKSVRDTVSYLIEATGVANTEENRRDIYKEYRAYIYSANDFFNLSIDEKNYLSKNFHDDVQKFLNDFTRDSPLAKILTIGESGGSRFIKTFMGSVNTTEQEAIWEDWEDLLKDDSFIYDSEIKRSDFAAYLVKYSYYNSGFTQRKNTFYQHIPSSFLEAIGFYDTLKQAKKNLESMSVDTAFVEQYVRNNPDKINKTSLRSGVKIEKGFYFLDKKREDLDIVKIETKGSMFSDPQNFILVKVGENEESNVYKKFFYLGEGRKRGQSESGRNFFEYSYGIETPLATRPVSQTYLNKSEVVFEKRGEDYVIKGIENYKITTKDVELDLDGRLVTLKEPIVTNGEKTLSLGLENVFDTKEASLAFALNKLKQMSFEMINTTLNNAC